MEQETIEVTVKPHHLKGNAWSHADSPENRRCPLEEALKEMGHHEATVGARVALIDDIFYEINVDEWNHLIVGSYVRQANGGSIQEVHLKLTKRQR